MGRDECTDFLLVTLTLEVLILIKAPSDFRYHVMGNCCL